MRNKIEEIVRQMNHGEIEPEDGVDKLCDLHNVSQQRELLLDFTIALFQWEHDNTKAEEEIVDNYINRKSNNCG